MAAEVDRGYRRTFRSYVANDPRLEIVSGKAFSAATHNSYATPRRAAALPWSAEPPPPPRRPTSSSGSGAWCFSDPELKRKRRVASYKAYAVEGKVKASLLRAIRSFVFDLANCNLSGPIPPSLGRLKHLGSLFLHKNNLSGDIPQELGDRLNLQSLDLSNNGLTGEIPASFENLTQLKLLNLFRNHLRDCIPPFIGDFSNLEVLQVSK
ncbi:hypothetical protein J5N97_015356 [Dioscorea zingiberensis]|uniref:Uncharacterized protein n=1 Tax=Dioscorea zingiberensis TaxID=325984 RepID=A0A9D5CVQ4_9LILI|nr:hypothetical protein J5N97_015356 [Dioscorea zingiberensis]